MTEEIIYGQLGSAFATRLANYGRVKGVCEVENQIVVEYPECWVIFESGNPRVFMELNMSKSTIAPRMSEFRDDKNVTINIQISKRACVSFFWDVEYTLAPTWCATIVRKEEVRNTSPEVREVLSKAAWIFADMIIEEVLDVVQTCECKHCVYVRNLKGKFPFREL